MIAPARLTPTARALQRLCPELTPAISAALPRVTPILAHAEQGLPQVLDALRGSDDRDARVFIEKYDSLTLTDRKIVKWEDIGYAVNVTPKRLLEVAVSALAGQAQSVSGIIAATSHPKVVEKNVQQALSGNLKASEMLHVATGFLPTPKGPTMIGRLVQIANLGRPDIGEAQGEVPPDLPTMEESMSDLHDLRVKLLTDGAR